MVKCPSGLRSTPGKCVNVYSVSRVRIPLSPPKFFDIIETEKEFDVLHQTLFLSLYNFTFILPVVFIYCSILIIPKLNNYERIINHPDWAKFSFKTAPLDTFKLHFEWLFLKNNAIRLNNNQYIKFLLIITPTH